MEILKPTKTVFTAAQFLNWQRNSTLVLQPDFQRREVWKKQAKSYLIDSLIRGYPVPIILLRQVQDLKTLDEEMEVVDGQQRLRTLLGFLDPTCLPDFDESRDLITVSKSHNHNPQIHGKSFDNLPDKIKSALLSYEFSTHVFPSSTGDEQVYRIFARLNSTGLNLNPQEIRNATYHGVLKSLVYEIGLSKFDYWQNLNVFGNYEIARMAEAEAVSDMLYTMKYGINSKRQKALDTFYEEYEDSFPGIAVAKSRINTTLDEISKQIGSLIAESSLSRSTLFMSLYCAVYAHMYGLKSPFKRTKARRLPARFQANAEALADDIAQKLLPETIQDAMDKATANKAKRETRHKYLMKRLGLSNAK